MQHFSAQDAGPKFGQLLDAVRDGPVAIDQGGCQVAVLMSKDAFDELQAWNLDRLRGEVHKGIAAIERGDFTDVPEGDLSAFADQVKSAGRRRPAA
jgi:prevent-host-death family protein